MENGTASPGGNGDRRKTVSGPLPDLENDANDGHIKFSSETMRLPWNSPSTPTSPHGLASSTSQAKSTGHKRSFSGGILAKLNFLGRPPSRGEQDAPQSPKSPKSTKSRKSIDDDNETAISPVSPTKGESAMAAAMKQSKTRKRKGSLRKTALLGGRRLVTEGRERKNTILQRSPTSKQPKQSLEQQGPAIVSAKLYGVGYDTSCPPGNESNTSLRERFSYENVDANASSDSGWSQSAAATSARLSLLTDHSGPATDRKASTELASPLDLKSPVSQASYASTTDDDDVLTFDRPANSFVSQPREPPTLKKPLSSTATSYFPSMTSVSVESVTRRLSSKQRSSPLSHNITTLSSYPESEPHDYTETEYWGWIILFVTWLTFTVGMGSCLEIWSWAWDVGETPYAPPELEDDPTLPIVGYYPALIVLTGVVAWAWILVAWLGMKYFRHAKIEA
ncbi:hypothetical protein M409DRAFT_66296 [Zasmidium cellare ATCC 36951]|uniref:Uncharacterized protein n=1 Tax=Zasmidium cellare ATCC 36951 TaxID=1080233 RepID=A0A6A6CM48_ZASCE|nr:uncharacterized protein M409DRAFT_66296 [Zasmidium cellare ATCC 36951]KAF2167298.1 hypothetical protein M409DRAFT_66296 [Zasmidium cellare ATCC 36951]